MGTMVQTGVSEAQDLLAALDSLADRAMPQTLVLLVPRADKETPVWVWQALVLRAPLAPQAVKETPAGKDPRPPDRLAQAVVKATLAAQDLTEHRVVSVRRVPLDGRVMQVGKVGKAVRAERVTKVGRATKDLSVPLVQRACRVKMLPTALTVSRGALDRLVAPDARACTATPQALELQDPRVVRATKA